MSESFQEQFIQELSSHLLGHQSVFKPELYDMSREPADLAWISDRCVAIVHATKGGKPLQKKRKHNNFQMHTWLRKWRQGHILRGPNVALSYDDIDYVIGLSVVGGREAASIIEDGEILHARKKDISKLFACATITDAVFERLCQKSVGLKDIIHFFEYLRNRGDLVSDDDALEWIDYWENHHLHRALTQFSGILPNELTLSQSWLHTKDIITGLKSRDGLSQMGSDLSFSDVIWISVAEPSLAYQLGQPGWRVLCCTKPYGDYTVCVAVSLTMMDMAAVSLDRFPDNGFMVRSTLDAGADNPMRIITAADDIPGWTLYRLLEEFANATGSPQEV